MRRGMKMKKRSERAITLIALVITIIVLLILAAVSIAMLTGENGILNKSQQTKTEQIKAELEEQFKLAMYELKIEKKEKSIELSDITIDILKSKIKDSEIQIEVTEEKEDSKSEVMTLSEDSSKTKYKEIRLTKSEVTVIFRIDEKLNITKVDGEIEISYDYNKEDINGDDVEVVIYVRDAENGINQIMIDGIEVGGFAKGSKDKIEITYNVKLGQSYKMTIVTTKGETKEETISINITHKITTDLAEGLSMAEEVTEVQYNQSYTAKIIEDDEYLVDELTVTMGGEVLTEGIDALNGTIHIEKVTGDIVITATATPCDKLLEFNSVYCHNPNVANTRDTNAVEQVLFNGNINESGYGGVMIGPLSSKHYIEFTVYKEIKIYVCGKSSTNIYPNSWATALDVLKWNGNSFAQWEKPGVNNNGTWYEFVTLPKGRYQLKTLGSQFVCFAEWRLEIVK